MKIKIIKEDGYKEALFGIGLNKKLTSDYNDFLSLPFEIQVKLENIAQKLAPLDGGHNKFLESIIVWLDIKAPLYWWKQFDTYRVGVTKQSDCFDKETEILTNNGWKFFYELTKTDLVCTLNPINKQIEYQKPIKYVEESYKGEMIHLSSNKFNQLITPNHELPISKRNTNDIVMVRADKFKPYHTIIKNCHTWQGKPQEFFILPQVTSKWNTGCRKIIKNYPEVKIPMEDWLAFLGIWLSEGRTKKEKRNYNTYIFQNTNNKCYKELCLLMDKLPFKVHKLINGIRCRWIISNLQLYTYLKNLGNTYTKYIPIEYLKLDKHYLKILLWWLMAGDGTDNYDKNYTYLYSTVSKKLADGVQELFIKTGNIANIYPRNDKRKASYKTLYTINRSKTKSYRIQKQNITSQMYDDKIYCVEVPNHIIMVRRDGKATWTGNSTMHSIMNHEIKIDDFETIDLQRVSEILNPIINQLNDLRLTGDFYNVNKLLPQSYLQRRIVVTNYKTLKNIYHQRKNHKLPEWQTFCKALSNLWHYELIK